MTGSFTEFWRRWRLHRDFCFERQSAEELLARMEYLEFHDSWLSMEQSLETVVSDVFEVTKNAVDSNYATVIHVPADFAAQYEGPLYILRRDKKTGKVEIVKQISSQEDLDALPRDESRRDYKIYSNGTYGMSAGYQYAIAEKIGEEKEDGFSG